MTRENTWTSCGSFSYSATQEKMANALIALIKEYAEKAFQGEKSEFVFADYGSATGSGSIGPIKAINEIVNDASLSIILINQEGNDWQEITKTLKANLPPSK